MTRPVSPRPRTPRKPGGRPGAAARLLLAGLCLVGAAPALAFQADLPALNDRQKQELAFFTESLRNTTNSASSRAFAAQQLVRLGVPQAVTVLEESLRSGDGDLIAAVIRGLEMEPSAPPGLLDPLALALKGATPQRAQTLAVILARYGERGLVKVTDFALDATNEPAVRLGAIRALVGFRSPETVRASVDALVRIIQPQRNEPQAILDAAYESLERLTSLTNFGRDTEAWSEWWALMHRRPLEDWLPSEVDRLVQRLEAAQRQAELMKAENDALQKKLDDTLKELWFKLVDLDPTRARAQAELTKWMGDEHPFLRRWALNRADIQTSENLPLTDEVRRAIVARLEDGVPDIRVASARLLHKIGHPDTAALVGAALEKETVAENRLGFLDILGRRAAPAALPTLLTLMKAPATRDGAVGAVQRIVTDGVLPPDQRGVVLEAAREAFGAAVTRGTIRLLASLAEAADVEKIIPLLDHAEATIRTAAAEALRPFATAWGELFTRSQDAAIYPSAVHVLANGEPTISNFERLIALVPPTADHQRTWREGLRGLGNRLTPADLVIADRALVAVPVDRLPTPDVWVLRESILARVLTMPLDGVPTDVRAQLHLVLARVRVRLGQFEPALVALDRTNGAPNGLATEAAQIRFDVLLRLGRYDEAALLRANAADWIAALERLMEGDLKIAAAVKTEIERRFTDLSEQAREQIRAIASRLPPVSPPAGNGGDGGGGSGGNSVGGVGAHESSTSDNGEHDGVASAGTS
ncbi:MAG: hypothetical protein HRU76_15715 [Phycisphaeraceae bacterium]|nr:MAG: hypothetical protein HRU76_15715 [Phycisphaeraceae bacterium]